MPVGIKENCIRCDIVKEGRIKNAEQNTRKLRIRDIGFSLEMNCLGKKWSWLK